MIKQVPLDVGTFFLQNTSFRTRLCFFPSVEYDICIHTVLIVHSIHFKKLNKLHTSFSKPKIQLTCFFKIYYFESLNILSMSGFHAFLLLLVVNNLYILSGAMCILFSFYDINAIFYIRVCCHRAKERMNGWLFVNSIHIFIQIILYVYAIIMYSKETSHLLYDIEWYPVINMVILIIRDNILNTLYFSPMKMLFWTRNCRSNWSNQVHFFSIRYFF